jgi:hypothetical protein
VSALCGTTFCLVIAFDLAKIVDGEFLSQAALVSADAGQTSAGYDRLPSAIQVTDNGPCA